VSNEALPQAGVPVIVAAPPARKRFLSRVWGVLAAAWGAAVGVAPHVLHHVGPIAGAAVLAGATGRALFAVLGLVVSIPLLLRLRRRFQTWIAPAIALTVMAAMFALSSFVIGPLITGNDSPEPAPTGQTTDEHHGH